MFAEGRCRSKGMLVVEETLEFGLKEGLEVVGWIRNKMENKRGLVGPSYRIHAP